MKQVSDHVYIDPDSGGCTVGAIKTPRGVVLVDTPPHKPTRAMRWREEVKTMILTISTMFFLVFGFGLFLLLLGQPLAAVQAGKVQSVEET